MLRTSPERIVVQLKSIEEVQSNKDGIWYHGPLGIEKVFFGDEDITNDSKYIFTVSFYDERYDTHFGPVGSYLFGDTLNAVLHMVTPDLAAPVDTFRIILKVTNHPDHPPFGPYYCEVPITARAYGDEVLFSG